MAWTPPSACTISPVVRGNQSDSSATQTRAAGSGSLTSQPIGARVSHIEDSSSKPGMLFAAFVRSPEAHARITSVDASAALARDGVHAVVTGPVSKEQLYNIGFSHPGQTEFIAERCGVSASNVAMMLAGPTLRTVPVTTHMPLAEVSGRLTPGLIAARGRATRRSHS